MKQPQRSTVAVAALLLLLFSGSGQANLRRHDSSRITNGQSVRRPYPFFIEWEYGCGGSLIHEDIMLTAAHCYHPENPFLLLVYIGGRRSGRGVVTRTMTHLIPHPQFEVNVSLLSPDLSYDFMVVKLNASALVHGEIGAPINGTSTVPYYSTQASLLSGDTLTVMGYDSRAHGSYFTPSTLQHVTVQAWSDQDCFEAYSDSLVPIDPDVMFCASGQGGKDSCQGDSGGPIIDEDNVQVGVVSYGESCGDDGFPGVYSRISAVQDWIQETICRWSCYPPPDCDPALTSACAKDTSTSNLNLTLEVNLDGFPNEVGLIVEHVETATELLFVPYETLSAVNETITFRWTNQLYGTYRIVAGDTGRDGVCCDHGQGNLTLINDDTGDRLWFGPGNFGSMLEEFVPVRDVSASDNGSGCIGNCGEGNEIGFLDPSDYQPILQSGKLQYPEAGATHQFVLNVQYDLFSSQQQEWTLEKHMPEANPEASETQWTQIDSGKPATETGSFSYEFATYQIQGLDSDALYRLDFRDSKGDGMSDDAWVVLTNGTATNSNPQGTIMWVVQGGDFLASATAYIWVDSQGNTNILRGEQVQQYQEQDPLVQIEIEVVAPGQANVARERSQSHPSYDVINPP